MILKERNPLLVLFVMVVAFSLAIWLAYSPSIQAQPGPLRGIPIGAATVYLNGTHLLPGGEHMLVAFIPTGSLNGRCLVTLAETSMDFGRVTVFCGARAPQGWGNGVKVTMFFEAPMPLDLSLVITLYQEGALRYGTPVLCNIPTCY